MLSLRSSRLLFSGVLPRTLGQPGFGRGEMRKDLAGVPFRGNNIQIVTSRKVNYDVNTCASLAKLAIFAVARPGRNLEIKEAEKAKETDDFWQGPAAEASPLASSGLLSRRREICPRLHGSQESDGLCQEAEEVSHGEVGARGAGSVGGRLVGR